MLTFSVFSVIFLAIGIVLFIMSDQIAEFSVQYHDYTKCTDALQKGKECRIAFKSKIDTKVAKPIYVYYQLDNFY